MKKTRARDFISKKPPILVRASSPIRDVVAAVIEDRDSLEVYVIEDDGQFIGVVPICRLARTVFAHHVSDRTSVAEMLDRVSRETAEDVALRRSACVTADATLADALEAMLRLDLPEIPVIAADRTVIGSVHLLDLLTSWHAGSLEIPP